MTVHFSSKAYKTIISIQHIKLSMKMDGQVMDFTKITDMITNVGKWKIIIDEKLENISELTCYGFSYSSRNVKSSHVVLLNVL